MMMNVDLLHLEQQLRAYVVRLAASPRPPDSRQHRSARAYIQEALHSHGFDVRESPFSSFGAEGINLLTAPFPDRPDLPLLIVGAHYDTRPDTPGADDNASGVAALIELGAWIGPVIRSTDRLGARLQLAAYDLEE